MEPAGSNYTRLSRRQLRFAYKFLFAKDVTLRKMIVSKSGERVGLAEIGLLATVGVLMVMLLICAYLIQNDPIIYNAFTQSTGSLFVVQIVQNFIVLSLDGRSMMDQAVLGELFSWSILTTSSCIFVSDLLLKSIGHQTSSRLSSMMSANALLELPTTVSDTVASGAGPHRRYGTVCCILQCCIVGLSEAYKLVLN
ncbi:hypothetical protein HS088_TW08G00692 [Tripterygium wilfordii]|uniref:MoeA C-terminal domain-containing protein n=1 Tax=Tripterygium wilfordii TaxID=458696 RepID=A0A7J7DCW1_TRIWF|nr:hypothetical protein HS088_TW08G00692 [Tripterygium wilfordii]